MPRTALTVVTLPGKHPGTIAANAADFSFAAGDAANGNQFTSTGKEILVVYNSDGASARSVTIKSVNDPYSRTGDITNYSVGIGEYAAFGPIPVSGWMQSDGKVYIDVSDATLKLAVFKIPD